MIRQFVSGLLLIACLALDTSVQDPKPDIVDNNHFYS